MFEALASSPTFASSVFGKIPLVLECGEASAHQWTVEDQVMLLSPNAYPCCEQATVEPISLSKNSKFTHPEIGHGKAHSFMAVVRQSPGFPLGENEN